MRLRLGNEFSLFIFALCSDAQRCTVVRTLNGVNAKLI